MPSRARLIGRVVVSLATVGVFTAGYFVLVPVNPTTVALTYVVVVLLIATQWGIVEATAAAVAAVACFNFFFLPPYLTWTIADSQNWVAFVVFMLTAVIVSQLSGRSRQRQIEAVMRQRDLERLYALSRALLLSDRGASVPGEIARRIADAFTMDIVGVYDQRTDIASWAGVKGGSGNDALLREVARRGMSSREESGLMIEAIHLGGAPIGSIAVPDAGLNDTVLRSIANLAAIGLERARADEATARADAARESSELRATVLDALAHEFKTPLTSMRAASSDLLGGAAVGSKDRELVEIIDEELDRLGALVTDAIRMLRIDAGDFTMHPGRHALSPLVAATMKGFERRVEGHDLVEQIPPDLTIDADRELVELALRQLLDNALKYSTPTSTISVRARNDPARGVTIAVHNSGSSIPPHEQARIFERFYRGAPARHLPGTGMGLAIVQQIARLHGGSLSVTSDPDAGTTFTLSFPLQGGQA